MKIAASTLALPAFDHLPLLPRLAEMGVAGIEIAPAHTWPGPWRVVAAAAIDDYRRAAGEAGLAITGLHAPLAGRPELGLFKGPEALAATIDFLAHLSAVCRDLGGRTVILGGRRRGALAESDAWTELRAFLETLLPRIEPHGTVLCLAPVGPTPRPT